MQLQLESDTAELVWSETARLVEEVVKANNIEPEDIASITISTTPDIKSAFPAKSVRLMEGWQYVPIMCMHEMDVPGALPLCIRVLMHVNTDVATKRNSSYLFKRCSEIKTRFSKIQLR